MFTSQGAFKLITHSLFDIPNNILDKKNSYIYVICELNLSFVEEIIGLDSVNIQEILKLICCVQKIVKFLKYIVNKALLESIP